MKVSLQVPKDFEEKIDIIRQQLYPNKTANNIRDSYVISQAILALKDTSSLTKDVTCDLKKTKNLSLSFDAYTKLTSLSEQLKINTSEIIRRLVINYAPTQEDLCDSELINKKYVEIKEIYDRLGKKLIELELLLNERNFK